VGRGDVLVISAFVARAEATGLARGAKAQVMATSRLIRIATGSSSPHWRSFADFGRPEGRIFWRKAMVAKPAE
jgi:hypothetical protein